MAGLAQHSGEAFLESLFVGGHRLCRPEGSLPLGAEASAEEQGNDSNENEQEE